MHTYVKDEGVCNCGGLHRSVYCLFGVCIRNHQVNMINEVFDGRFWVVRWLHALFVGLDLCQGDISMVLLKMYNQVSCQDPRKTEHFDILGSYVLHWEILDEYLLQSLVNRIPFTPYLVGISVPLVELQNIRSYCIGW